MKKNLLIMMMMVLCAGFVSAQTQTPTINTVRGFVPGGSTGVITGTADQPTYVVFGAPYGAIQPMDQFYEVSASIAQMQLLTDTVFAVITCQQGYYDHGFNLSWDDIEELLEEQEQDCDAEGNHVYAENQMRNVAINYYYYDSLIVLNLYICPCSTMDQHENEYEVIALNNECWFKSNLRDEVIPSTLYNSEQYEVTAEMDSVYGRLYTYANVATGSCDEDNYLQGACPDGWHLITAEEAQAFALIPADQLRYEQNWIVSEGTNTTGFSAQPAGVYNTSTGRYEGIFSETDYWVVKDCQSLTDPVQNIIQIAYYCNTPILMERPAGDQLSVRCVYDIIREFDKHNCIPIPDPDPYGCPRFGTMTVSEDQLGFTLPIGGDYEGATVTLTYSAGIDYTVGNTEPGTTGYAYDNNLNNPTTLTIENGKVTWHYTLPADVTEDMISLTVTVILEKGDCRDRIQKNLKTVTPPTQPTCLTFDHQYQNVQVNVTTVSAKILDFDPTKIYQLKAEALSIKTTDPDYPEFGLDPQIVSLDLVNADGILTWSLPTTATPSFDGAIIEMRGQFTIYGDENTPCDEFGFETQATPAQELVCPVLSQITIGTTYNYSATISNYDEHAGAFEVEYRVYQVGSTSPMVPSVYENNLSFTQGDQSGVITVSGQMSDAILNQYDQISKIEVFLVYTPSDLFGQCHKDSVYATIYEATPAQECAFSVSQEFTLVDNGYRLDVYNNTGDANAITGIEAECYWHGTDDNVRAESGGTNAYDNPRFQRFSDPQDETHAYYIFYLPDPNYATPNPTTTASIDLKVTFRLKSAYSICNTPDYDGIHREKLDIPYQN